MEVEFPRKFSEIEKKELIRGRIKAFWTDWTKKRAPQNLFNAIGKGIVPEIWNTKNSLLSGESLDNFGQPTRKFPHFYGKVIFRLQIRLTHYVFAIYENSGKIFEETCDIPSQYRCYGMGFALGNS